MVWNLYLWFRVCPNPSTGNSARKVQLCLHSVLLAQIRNLSRFTTVTFHLFSKETREKNCSHLGLWLLLHGLFIAWWLFHWDRGNRERRWRSSKKRRVLLLLQVHLGWGRGSRRAGLR